MTQTTSQRLRNFERLLRKGKMPRLKKFLPGAEKLALLYSLDPSWEIFLPPPNWKELPAANRKKLRAKFSASRRYQKERIELLGPEFKAKQQRMHNKTVANLIANLEKKNG